MPPGDAQRFQKTQIVNEPVHVRRRHNRVHNGRQTGTDRVPQSLDRCDMVAPPADGVVDLLRRALKARHHHDTSFAASG